MYFNHVDTKCSEMKYVFKGDDDILILPPNFLKMLEQLDGLEGRVRKFMNGDLQKKISQLEFSNPKKESL